MISQAKWQGESQTSSSEMHDIKDKQLERKTGHLQNLCTRIVELAVIGEGSGKITSEFLQWEMMIINIKLHA